MKKGDFRLLFMLFLLLYDFIDNLKALFKWDKRALEGVNGDSLEVEEVPITSLYQAPMAKFTCA